MSAKSKPAARKFTKRTTQAYLDNLTNVLTVVPPNGRGAATFATQGPDDLSTFTTAERADWARQTVEENGYATAAEFKTFTYPWGIGFNVRAK